MTQTRESSQDLHYRKLAARSRKLFAAINEQMDRTTPDDERWRELHDLFKLAQVILSACERYRDRQDEDNKLDAELAVAIAEANPGHPLTADTMLPAGEPVDYWPDFGGEPF